MADAGEEGEQAPAELQAVPPLTEEEASARAAVFDQIFSEWQEQDIKGKSIAERKENNQEDAALTYSGSNFDSVNKMLNSLKAGHGPFYEKGVFLDLGSGTGRACIAAAMHHPFDKVVGIECVQCLCEVATAAAARYQEAQLPGPEDGKKPEVQFIKGDFVTETDTHLESVIPEVTCCMAVAACFGEKEMQALVAIAKRMVPGSVVITVTKPLPEAFVIDDNRHPKQRRAAAMRRVNCKRGVEPIPVDEVEVDPPENEVEGFLEVLRSEVQVPWAESATYFVYRKPQKEVGADEGAPVGEGEGAGAA